MLLACHLRRTRVRREKRRPRAEDGADDGADNGADDGPDDAGTPRELERRSIIHPIDGRSEAGAAPASASASRLSQATERICGRRTGGRTIEMTATAEADEADLDDERTSLKSPAKDIRRDPEAAAWLLERARRASAQRTSRASAMGLAEYSGTSMRARPPRLRRAHRGDGV